MRRPLPVLQQEINEAQVLPVARILLYTAFKWNVNLLLLS